MADHDSEKGAPKRGNRSMMLIGIGLLAVVGAGGGAAAYFLLGDQKPAGEAGEHGEEVAEAGHGEAAEGGHGAPAEESGKGDTPSMSAK